MNMVYKCHGLQENLRLKPKYALAKARTMDIVNLDLSCRDGNCCKNKPELLFKQMDQIKV